MPWPHFPAGHDPDHAGGVPGHGRGRPQPAWFSALRCIQQNEDAATWLASTHRATRSSPYTLFGAVLRDRRRSLRVVDGYIDPTESFSILMSIQDPVMCRLAGPNRFGPSHRHRRLHGCSKRCSGQLPRLQPRHSRLRHRRPDPFSCRAGSRAVLSRRRPRGLQRCPAGERRRHDHDPGGGKAQPEVRRHPGQSTI